MTTYNDEEDALILQRWLEFRENYAELGYRRVSYEYFAKWLQAECPDIPSFDDEELRRRLHAYRKRLRNRP